MDKEKVSCRILDIQPIPGSNIQLVSIEFTYKDRVWNTPFRLNYDRPISMEEFKLVIAEKVVLPEKQDFLAFVREEANEPFEIQVDKSLLS